MYQAALTGGEPRSAPLRAALLKRLGAPPAGQEKFAAARRERIQSAASQLAEVKDSQAAWDRTIAALAAKAATVQETIRKELGVVKTYSETPLAYLRIGVAGKAAPTLLDDPACRYVESLKPEITEEIMSFDVLCLKSSHKLSPDEHRLLRAFVQSGRGLLVVGGTPHAMIGAADLTPIADWLGARAYGNCKGALAAPAQTVFTQGLDGWLAQTDAGRGAGAVSGFVTAVPILVYTEQPQYAFLAANKCGSGRVVYSATGQLPAPLLHKILLWLGYNKLRG
jgi:hypothetical protein